MSSWLHYVSPRKRISYIFCSLGYKDDEYLINFYRYSNKINFCSPFSCIKLKIHCFIYLFIYLFTFWLIEIMCNLTIWSYKLITTPPVKFFLGSVFLLCFELCFLSCQPETHAFLEIMHATVLNKKNWND